MTVKNALWGTHKTISNVCNGQFNFNLFIYLFIYLFFFFSHGGGDRVRRYLASILCTSQGYHATPSQKQEEHLHPILMDGFREYIW